MSLKNYGNLSVVRDLSKIPLGGSKKTKTLHKLRYLKFLAGIILVLAVAAFARDKLNIGTASDSSISLHEAPRGLKPVKVEDDNADLLKQAADLKTESINFQDIRYNGRAKATAVRSYGGGIYILTVDATLPDPVNTNYQVWLAGGGEVVPIDFMNGSKTEWSLNVRAKDTYSNYDEIWITLERNKDDLPEEHIMEGTF